MIQYVKKHIYRTIGFFTILLGIILLITNHTLIIIVDENENESEKIDHFFEQDNAVLPNTEIIVDNDKPEQKEKEEEYVAVLEIPKINLKKGLSYYKNSINYNIEIIDGSTFPDTDESNLILAAHNGNSRISFFKNLHKLTIGDKVYLYYNNIKYEFVIATIYDVKKDGTVEIERDAGKKAVTLITCKNNSKNLQSVYIGYLNNTYSY